MNFCFFFQINTLDKQFLIALQHKKHSARYNLRQKLAIVTGLKVVSVNYIQTKKEKLLDLNMEIEQYE